jgi:low temperature requirement protein LtrA
VEPTAQPHAQRPSPATPPQSWLELFYDLAFVAAIVVVSGAYSKDYSLLQIAWLVIAFSLVWTTWLMATVLLSRTVLVGTYQRAILVAQMALVLLMAVTSYDFIEDNTGLVGPLFAVILVTQLLLRHKAGPRASDSPASYTGQNLRLGAAAVLFVATWWAGGAVYVGLWAVGLLFVLSTVGLWGTDLGRNREHLAHRFGEFTIIMLGESFLKIGLVVTEESLEEVELLGLPLTFVLMSSIWWLYFGGVGRRGLPHATGSQPWWVLWHFPLHMFIAALAVGLSKVLLPEGYIEANRALMMISLPLMGILGSLAVLEWLTGGSASRPRTGVLVGATGVTGMTTMFTYAARDDVSDLIGTGAALAVIVLAAVWLIGRRAPD